MTPMHPERLPWWNGCLVMEATAAQYRKFAEECELFAKVAQSERHRSVLKEMADARRKLVAQVDKTAA
jgi:hypothetical protein